MSSAGASLNEAPAPNYSNWPSIFWRPLILVATLVNNHRLLVATIHEVHLHGPFTYLFLVLPCTYLYANVYGNGKFKQIISDNVYSHSGVAEHLSFLSVGPFTLVGFFAFMDPFNSMPFASCGPFSSIKAVSLSHRALSPPWGTLTGGSYTVGGLRRLCNRLAKSEKHTKMTATSATERL